MKPPPPEGKKLVPLDTLSEEVGVDAARAVGELLSSGGQYSFRHIELDLIWRGAGAARWVPLAAGLGCGALILAGLLTASPGAAARSGLLYSLHPFAAALVAVVHMRVAAGALAGAPPPGLGQLVRDHAGLVARALGLQLVLVLGEGMLRTLVTMALPFSVLGTFGIYFVYLGMSAAFFWVHLHVWSELALGDARPLEALLRGGGRALGHLLELPGALLRLPGRLARRWGAGEAAPGGAADLALSMVFMQGAGVLSANFLTALGSLLLGTHMMFSEANVSVAVLATLSLLSYLAILALGLGRWVFYDLADRLEEAGELPREGPASPRLEGAA